jgi:hypothetical protein
LWEGFENVPFEASNVVEDVAMEPSRPLEFMADAAVL